MRLYIDCYDNIVYDNCISKKCSGGFDFGTKEAIANVDWCNKRGVMTVADYTFKTNLSMEEIEENFKNVIFSRE